MRGVVRATEEGWNRVHARPTTRAPRHHSERQTSKQLGECRRFVESGTAGMRTAIAGVALPGPAGPREEGEIVRSSVPAVSVGLHQSVRE